MTKKAFLFDLDGVIIDSETWWDKLWFYQLTGPSIGYSIRDNYQDFKKLSPQMTWQQFMTKMDRLAKKIYSQAPLTSGINQLLDRLIHDGYRLAVVSGSAPDWIQLAIKRLHQPFAAVISLHDHPDCRSKPAPDGYLTIMQQLQIKPQNAMILEDSQLGIDSAKAAGAYTICLTEFHPKNYQPLGADLYVKNLTELLKQLPIKILPRTN